MDLITITIGPVEDVAVDTDKTLEVPISVAVVTPGESQQRSEYYSEYYKFDVSPLGWELDLAFIEAAKRQGQGQWTHVDGLAKELVRIVSALEIKHITLRRIFASELGRVDERLKELENKNA